MQTAELVQTKPEAPSTYANIQAPILAQVIFDAEAELELNVEAFDRENQGLRDKIAEMRTALIERLVADEVTLLPHETLLIECTQKGETEKRFNELLQLREIIPLSELARAMWLKMTIKVPLELEDTIRDMIRKYINDDRVTIEYEADARVLNGFGKAGKRVKEILTLGLVKVKKGPFNLAIRRKTQALKNVTPRSTSSDADLDALD